jgi:hypothetical protein
VHVENRIPGSLAAWLDSSPAKYWLATNNASPPTLKASVTE